MKPVVHEKPKHIDHSTIFQNLSKGNLAVEEMKLEQKNGEIMYNHLCPMDLGLFQALERERVLEVLQRDKALRTIEADRIRYEKYF